MGYICIYIYLKKLQFAAYWQFIPVNFGLSYREFYQFTVCNISILEICWRAEPGLYLMDMVWKGSLVRKKKRYKSIKNLTVLFRI